MADNNEHPMGGWFGTLGGLVGMVYGASIDWLFGTLIGGVIGAYIGLAIEHILARILIIAMFVLMILGRQVFFDAIFENAGIETTSPQHHVTLIAARGHGNKLGALS